MTPYHSWLILLSGKVPHVRVASLGLFLLNALVAMF